MEKIILGVFTLIGGALGALIALWAKWGIEQRRQKLAYRKELIASWRKMIKGLWKDYYPEDKSKGPIQPIIWLQMLNYDAWYSLKPHLQHEMFNVEVSDIHHPRTILNVLITEIGRIEKEWDLL